MLQRVLKEVLKEIKPTKEHEEKMRALSVDVINTAKNQARPYKASAILAGSLTRDTWLPSKSEFDVFIIFPKNISEKDLEKFGLEVGKKIIERLGGEWRVDYAQHPYITGNVRGFVFSEIRLIDNE